MKANHTLNALISEIEDYEFTTNVVRMPNWFSSYNHLKAQFTRFGANPRFLMGSEMTPQNDCDYFLIHSFKFHLDSGAPVYLMPDRETLALGLEPGLILPSAKVVKNSMKSLIEALARNRKDHREWKEYLGQHCGGRGSDIDYAGVV